MYEYTLIIILTCVMTLIFRYVLFSIVGCVIEILRCGNPFKAIFKIMVYSLLLMVAMLIALIAFVHQVDSLEKSFYMQDARYQRDKALNLRRVEGLIDALKNNGIEDIPEMVDDWTDKIKQKETEFYSFAFDMLRFYYVELAAVFF